MYIYFIWPKNQSVFDTFVSLGRTFFIGHMHLWYIAATIEAAILLYIIRNIRDKYKIVLIFITYGIGLFIKYSGNYHLFASSMIDNLFNKGHVYRNFLFFGFPMFTLGYLIRKYQMYDNYSVKEIITFIFLVLFFLVVKLG